MEVVHPVHISPINTILLLIGMDFNCFEPLIDFQCLKIWTQVLQLLPLMFSPQCHVIDTAESAPQPGNLKARPAPTSEDDQLKAQNLTCSLKPGPDPQVYCPVIERGVQLQGTTVFDSVLALWAEKSAISFDLFELLRQHNPHLPYIDKAFRFPLGTNPQTTNNAKGVCALTVNWNRRELQHYFLVVPALPHAVYIGADVLVCLAAHLDTINNVVWSAACWRLPAPEPDATNLHSGWTIPEACEVRTELETTVPAYTKSVALQLNLKPGQNVTNPLVPFQPTQGCSDRGLTLEAAPPLEVTSRSVYILFNNCTAEDIVVPKATTLGWLIDSTFHGFELTVPVIGKLLQRSCLNR